jgi:membrane-bound lytic murein transglycosylase D
VPHICGVRCCIVYFLHILCLKTEPQLTTLRQCFGKLRKYSGTTDRRLLTTIIPYLRNIIFLVSFDNFMKNILAIFCSCFLFLYSNSQTIDSVLVKTRLASLKSSVPLVYNEEMLGYLRPLLANTNNRTSDIIYQSNVFLPYVESVVKAKKMPHALTYLPYVITRYMNESNADDGKVGVWNLPYAVARKYDLIMNSYIDERYNVVTSTESAMDYLVDLKHEFHNDWQLAVLAFCTSPTSVQQHMFKAGNAKTYEAILCDLDVSEKRFVSELVAATYIYSFYSEADIAIKVKASTPPMQTDTIDIFRKLTFDKIAATTGINRTALRTLNPIYKLETVPFNEAPHSLIIPKGYKASFDSLLQNYPNLEATRPVNDSAIILHDSDIAKRHPPAAAPTNKKVPVYYKVKPGENMYALADLFDCSVSDLKRWNRITRNYLMSGQVLTFYVPATKKAKYQKMNTLTAKQKKVIIYQD